MTPEESVYIAKKAEPAPPTNNVPACKYVINLEGAAGPSAGDGQYTATGSGWLDWDGATVTINTGDAPDGKPYLLYIKDDTPTKGVAVAFQNGSMIAPNGYQYYDESLNFFFGNIDIDTQYNNFNIADDITNVDWIVTYPNC